MSFQDAVKMSKSLIFLEEIIDNISSADKLHAKKVGRNAKIINEKYPDQFHELLSLIHEYFEKLKITPERISIDYLRMINDMRREGIYFLKNGKYRCENQQIAYELVYSKPEIMSYYMHALLISQVLWIHHFELFMFFGNRLNLLNKNDFISNILDVGPGHGFFSYIVQKQIPSYQRIDIVDISDTSLDMTKNIIGSDHGKINYFKTDIFEYEYSEKYDLILLGEVIEHLDNPSGILKKLSSLLTEKGILWVTTPTNSPALDHVYLFNSKEEVVSLIQDSGLDILDSCNYYAEEMDEKAAIRNKVTNLVGLFCKKKQ